MHEKLTLADSSGRPIVIRGDLEIISGNPSEVKRLQDEIESIRRAYLPRGNRMASLSFDFVMELGSRGWTIKTLEYLSDASHDFFSDAIQLAHEGALAEERSKTGAGLQPLLELLRARTLYRMSTLSLVFSCEAYINLYGVERPGKDEFESFERLASRISGL